MTSSLITRCPACSTAFRVVADQLRLRGGRVRCGICHHVFDASAHEVPQKARASGESTPRDADPAPVASPSSPARAASPASAPRPDAGMKAPPASAPMAASAPRQASGARVEPGWHAGGAPGGGQRSEPRLAGTAPMAPAPAEPRLSGAAPTTRRPEPRLSGAAPAPRAAEPRLAGAAPASRSPEPRLTRAAPATPASRPTEPRLGAGAPAPRAVEPRLGDAAPAADTSSEPRLGAPAPLRAPAAPVGGRSEPRFASQPAPAPAGRREPHATPAEPDDEDDDTPPFVAREPVSRPAARPSAPPPRREPVAAAPARTLDDEPEHAPEASDDDETSSDDTWSAHDEWADKDPVLRPHPGVDSPELAAARGEAWPPPLLTRSGRRHSLATRLFALGLVLALLILAVQAVWWWRQPLATHVPSTRPALQMLCGWFGCELGYVRAPQRLSIESSSVQPDTSAPGGDTSQRLTLTAVLRNRANHDQPWPSLELSLTDYSDTVVIRRVLPPEAYLPASLLEQPFPAGTERPISVAIQARGVPITGYRLSLFFP